MKKSVVLLLVVFVLLISLTSAKVIHDKWHTYHDFFTIGSDYYEVQNTVTEDWEQAKTLLRHNSMQRILSAEVVSQDNEYMILTPGCVTEGLYRYCIQNVSLDTDEGARTDEQGRFHMGTKIKIYEEIPDAALLEVTYEIATDTNFYVGSAKRVRMVVQNVGNKTATNTKINVTVPDVFEITELSDFDYRIGKILRKNIAVLASGNQEILDFTLKAKNYDTKAPVLFTNITYLKPASAKLNQKKDLVIPRAYTQTVKLSQAEVKTGEKTRLTVTVKNTENSEIAATVRVEASSGLDGQNFKNFRLVDGYFEKSFTLKPEEEYELIADYSSVYTGTYNISTYFDILVNGFTFSPKVHTILKVKNDRVTPNLLPSKERLRGGEEVYIGLFLTNEDNSVSYLDIQGEVWSDFFSQDFAIAKISPGLTTDALLREYTAPIVTEPTDYVIQAKGTFKTASGEQFSFSTQKTIKVMPEDQTIILTRTVDKEKVSRGDIVTVTVFAENIADTVSKTVSFEEFFDENLVVTFGTTKAEVQLQGDEERKLYVYKVKVPYDWTKDQFTLTSKMFSSGVEVSKKSATVTVDNPLSPEEVAAGKGTEPINQTYTNSTTSPNTNNGGSSNNNSGGSGDVDWGDDEPKKTNFFDAIITGIADFFTSLFS